MHIFMNALGKPPVARLYITLGGLSSLSAAASYITMPSPLASWPGHGSELTPKSMGRSPRGLGLFS